MSVKRRSSQGVRLGISNIANYNSSMITKNMNLTLQKSWRDSDDKCTFIVISAPDRSGASRSSAADLSAEIDNMVGDTNLFLQESTGELCYVSGGPFRYKISGFFFDRLKKTQG